VLGLEEKLDNILIRFYKVERKQGIKVGAHSTVYQILGPSWVFILASEQTLNAKRKARTHHQTTCPSSFSMSLYVQPRISVHHAHLPINEQSSNSLSGDGLASGLVDGLFPAQLFTSGISPWHELQPLRAVSRSWRAAIQRDRQPWADVLAFLNHQNQLDQKEPDEDEDEDEDGDEGWIGSHPRSRRSTTFRRGRPPL